MNTQILSAVFKRNLVGYFMNPTGYVFICVFVLLCSIAAFMPYEFFSANLANLNQLNKWIAMIMLVFIPAITMGIWAEEKRQGTDELLLTIPASDMEIVLGKYLAGASIFSVSLVFSMICSYVVLNVVGSPDIGLFISTYLGYWFIGLAMLSIGMVASFLTHNLTVAYILGAAFNAPLIALQWIDAFPISRETADWIRRFSITEQFDTFGRGIVSFSHILYFAAIITMMLYLSIVLIGRRHWSANQLFLGWFHYGVRLVSLLVIGISICVITIRFDARADMTAEKLSSLSRESIDIIKKIESDQPVAIKAYLSREMPKSFIQTQLNVISILGEIEKHGGSKVSVSIHWVEPMTDEALLIAERYKIEPRQIGQMTRGAWERQDVFLGVTMQCGLRTITLPFIDRGVSVEYELIHALGSVSTQQKKRLGILKTDSRIMGGVDLTTYSQRPTWMITEELKKQYNVIEIDPSDPITEKYDAILAVQPSALGPEELKNFIDALRNGQPAVILEDSCPFFGFVGTIEERVRQVNPMLGGGSRAVPKGDISELWSLLGVHYESSWVIWQDYNPYPKIGRFPLPYIFLDNTRDASAKASERKWAFNPADEVTESMQNLLMIYPGAIRKSSGSKFEYTPLVRTSRNPVGHMPVLEVRRTRSMGLNLDLAPLAVTDRTPFDLAVRIKGELPAPRTTPAPEGSAQPKGPELNVILVADTDMISDMFFVVRTNGVDPETGLSFDFDNIVFLLNSIDSIIGDKRFIEIRARKPEHRPLAKFDEATADIRKEANEKREQYQKEFEEFKLKGEKEMNAEIDELQKGNISTTTEAIGRLAMAIESIQKRLEKERAELERNRDIQNSKTEVELNKAIARMQMKYKMFAVLLPPIPPLLVALGVFIVRKKREYEGVPTTRRIKVKGKR